MAGGEDVTEEVWAAIGQVEEDVCAGRLRVTSWADEVRDCGLVRSGIASHNRPL